MRGTKKEESSLFVGIVFLGIMAILIYGITLIMPMIGKVGLIRFLISGLVVLAFSIVGVYGLVKVIRSLYYIEDKKFGINSKKIVLKIVIIIGCLILTVGCFCIGIERTTKAVSDMINEEIKVSISSIIQLDKEVKSKGTNIYYIKMVDSETKEDKEFEITKKYYNKLKKDGLQNKSCVKIAYYEKTMVIDCIEYEK